MWIVKLALDRPYTFVVVALLILLLGVFAIITTPTDIFPRIDIPVVSIIWTYTGLSTTEMEKRVTTFSEFVLATVNDIWSIESQTLNGVATIKVYFHPQVRIDTNRTNKLCSEWHPLSDAARHQSTLDLTFRCRYGTDYSTRTQQPDSFRVGAL